MVSGLAFMRLSCIISICLLGLIVNAQVLQTNGAAQYVDDQCIWFEATSNFKSGTTWSFDKLDFTDDLDLVFRINFGCANDQDGLAFVLQPTGAFAGNYSENLGVKGLSPSLIIELDVRRNLEDNDPTFDHIAVLLDGNLDHASFESLVPPAPLSTAASIIDKCIDHFLRIQFIAKDKLMVASFDCEEKLRFTIPDEQILRLAPFHYGCSAGLGSSVAIIELCPDYVERATDTTHLKGYCPGDTLTLMATKSGVEYQWRPSEVVFDPFKSVTRLVAPKEGVYSLLVIDECGLRFEEMFSLSSDAHLYRFSIDTILCADEEIIIDLSDQPFADRMRWNIGETNSLLTIQKEGEYFLNARDSLCLTSDTIRVQQFDALENKLGGDRQACFGSEILLGGSYLSHYDVEWLDGSNGQQMLASEPGSYGYSIDHRCGVHTEVIDIRFEDCSSIYIPSAFSPNGDGNNDFFKPYASSSEIHIESLAIFDRWGAQVYQLRAHPLFSWQGWDGTRDGVRLPAGTYLYVFEVGGVEAARYSGSVHMVR